MFLNDEQKASLESQLQNMHSDTQETPTASVAEVKVSSDSDVKSDVAKDVKPVNDGTEASSAEESGSQHTVPYTRFKDVNESKKQLQQKNSKLEKELQELRTQLTQKDEKGQEPKSELDKYLDSLVDNVDDTTDKKYSALESRIAAFEMKNAQVELDAEIKSVVKKFPDVPESILLQAVVQNPDSDLFHIANEYSQFIHGIEEKALARHKATSTPPVPTAPPRPQSVSSTGNSVGQNNGRPRTMAEARAAALNYFKQNGI